MTPSPLAYEIDDLVYRYVVDNPDEAEFSVVWHMMQARIGLLDGPSLTGEVATEFFLSLQIHGHPPGTPEAWFPTWPMSMPTDVPWPKNLLTAIATELARRSAIEIDGLADSYREYEDHLAQERAVEIVLDRMIPALVALHAPPLPDPFSLPEEEVA